jgi:hypothetical protein
MRTPIIPSVAYEPRPESEPEYFQRLAHEARLRRRIMRRRELVRRITGRAAA